MAQLFGFEASEVVGIAAGVLTSASMLPQVVKMVQEKKSITGIRTDDYGLDGRNRPLDLVWGDERRQAYYLHQFIFAAGESFYGWLQI